MISVIVPVYNVKKYIAKCVDSVLAQAYKDIELIIVDDGSNDGSETICEEYNKEDSGILVLHQANKGLVAARKAGAMLANGDFIFCVDGDDWIEPDTLEVLHRELLDTGADIVCAGHKMDYDGKCKRVLNKIASSTYDSKEISSKLIHVLTPYLWGKLYRKEIYLKYQMMVDERITVGEDAAVTYPLLSSLRTIRISENCGYHYTQRADSMMNKALDGEEVRCELVLSHLEKNLKVPNLEKQMADYKRQLLYVRLPHKSGILDELSSNDKVVIYGAGSFGRAVYRTIMDEGLAKVTAWLDRDFMYMKNIGLPVINSDEFDFQGQAYDKIIIAMLDKNVTDSVEKNIREQLQGLKKCTIITIFE